MTAAWAAAIYKGQLGDAMNVVLVAAGHNLHKILTWLRGLFAWLLRVNRHAKSPSRCLPACGILRTA